MKKKKSTRRKRNKMLKATGMSKGMLVALRGQLIERGCDTYGYCYHGETPNKSLRPEHAACRKGWNLDYSRLGRVENPKETEKIKEFVKSFTAGFQAGDEFRQREVNVILKAALETLTDVASHKGRS